MSELWNALIGSFNNSPDGASGKKLTALVCTIFGICIPIVSWTYWAYNHNDFSLLIGVLSIVTGFVSILFGINTYDKMKNKDSEPKE